LGDIVEIYTKLIIAIISFIAPLMIHLLSMFSETSSVIKRKAESEVLQIDELLKAQIQADGAQVQKLMKEGDSLYKARAKKLKRQENVLSPKRQIRRVFPVLFFALVFVVLYTAAVNNCWGGEKYNEAIEWILLCLSLLCSTFGVVFLKIIAWTVIEIKEQVAHDKEKSLQRVEKPIENN
jgi:hypothetical protein